MFTIYTKNVGGRVFDRYYREWNNARNALLKELEELKAEGWTVESSSDYFKSDKGIYIYGYKCRTPEGEQFSLFLHEGYFRD